MRLCICMRLQDFFAILGRGPLAFQIGKSRMVYHTTKLGNQLYGSAQLCHFWSIKNKLAITHTIAIKLKENVACVCVC